ncbi:hypothetical protein BHM03_00022418 [Ensete ventricosum]|nr:hypothetical protein BHM03_00022418 [Ensete ventricosum]
MWLWVAIGWKGKKEKGGGRREERGLWSGRGEAGDDIGGGCGEAKKRGGRGLQRRGEEAGGKRGGCGKGEEEEREGNTVADARGPSERNSNVPRTN